MVESLCITYGTFLGTVDGHKFYSFPTLEQLADVDETTLRDLGFGYPK
jgi:N-glycosylase/DNA lyase